MAHRVTHGGSAPPPDHPDRGGKKGKQSSRPKPQRLSLGDHLLPAMVKAAAASSSGTTNCPTPGSVEDHGSFAERPRRTSFGSTSSASSSGTTNSSPPGSVMNHGSSSAASSSSSTPLSAEEPNQAKTIYTDILRAPAESTDERRLAAIYGDWIRKILLAWSDSSMMPDAIKFALRGTFIHALELWSENMALHAYQEYTGHRLDFRHQAHKISDDLKYHYMDKILTAARLMCPEINEILKKIGSQFTLVARYEDSSSEMHQTQQFYHLIEPSSLPTTALDLFVLHFKIHLYVLQKMNNISELPSDDHIRQAPDLTGKEKRSIKDPNNQITLSERQCSRLDETRKTLRAIHSKYPCTLIVELDCAINWAQQGSLYRSYYPILVHTLYRTVEYSILHILRIQTSRSGITEHAKKKAGDYPSDYLDEICRGKRRQPINLSSVLLGKTIDYFNRDDSNPIMQAIEAVSSGQPLRDALYNKIDQLTAFLISIDELFDEPVRPKAIARPMSFSTSSQGPSSSSAIPLLAASPYPSLPASSSGFYTIPLNINGKEHKECICKIQISRELQQIIITPYLEDRYGEYEALRQSQILQLDRMTLSLIKALPVERTPPQLLPTSSPQPSPRPKRR